MVNTSKILTVSYGTFSCTLEGFDDSFDTMKAIAEYFRDLAADDRYFGAEPPTPDAEMLARIAEREISRRVEARQGDTGIVLRAAQAPEALGQAETPAAETPDEPPVAKAATEAPEAVPDAASEHAETEDTAEAITHEAEPEEAPAAPAIDEFPATHDTAEPETTETTTEVPVAFEDLPAPQPQAAQPEPADDDGDSVAARLRRIRSVVAQSGASYGSDYSEDEHAQDFLARTAEELENTLAGDDEAEAAEPQIEVTDFAAFTDDDADDSDETDGTIEWDAPEDDTADMAGETDDMVAEPGDEDDEDALGSIAAHLAEDAEAVEPAADAKDDAGEEALEDTLSEDTLSQLLADAMPDDTPVDTLDEEAVEIPADTAQEAPEDDDTAAQVRVLKMKRSEFEATLALGEYEEAPESAGEEDTAGEDTAEEAIDLAQEPGDAALSPEEEAELQRELAEVEAEFTEFAGFTEDSVEVEEVIEDTGEYEDEGDDANIFGETDSDEDRAADDAGMPYDRPAEQGRGAHLHASGADNDATRIFDEAENKLHAPDASRRRNAIQHLRAAVAASKAEIRAGNRLEPDPGAQQAAYRSDLAQVVRPRRPQADRRSRSPRPEDSRPAPLKLVAEQRVDTPREPVRPRRISAAQMAAEAAESAPTSGGFADFADEIGASGLPELLEAAAAYMADIEGREQFSRPMLMGKLKEATGEAFSREDGLRSFGHLLREGKLQKLRGGRFTVTEQTEFRAQARRAAG